jgi:peptidoglycan-N-acetylglucosamine deacetylase
VKKYWLLVLLSSVIFFASVILLLHRSPAIKVEKKDEKQIALTFDACMTYGMEKKLQEGKAKTYFNKPVIDELVKEKVPATLFLTGLWAKNYPEVTKSLSQNPLFEIGNHSYSHPGFTLGCFGLPFVKSSDKEKEFQMSQEILTELTGKMPTLFRFPGGCYSKSDLALAEKYNFKVVGWDIASGDAFNNNAKSIVKRVESKVKPGSIIVMHMNGDLDAPKTAEALPEIILFLKSEGYTFVRVSDLVK